MAQTTGLPTGGSEVLASDAYWKTEVGGLAGTSSKAQVVGAGAGVGFEKSVRVTIGANSAETNATQLTVMTNLAVKKGDRMVAQVYLKAVGSTAHAQLLFEKATSPWTKSTTMGLSAEPSEGWKPFLVAFESAEDYAPGAAMLSLRLAFGKQTLEFGGLRVVDYGQSKSLENLRDLAAGLTGPETMTIEIVPTEKHQKMVGLGGNFCQARYGHTEALDSVGRYVMGHLTFHHARIGLPLNYWAPERGKYVVQGQALASMEVLAAMTKTKIPTVVSVWEAAGWMLPGEKEQSGKVLPQKNYEACAKAIGDYLVQAKRDYGAKADYFSFNEPDYGVNFKFTPQTLGDFIMVAGPMWKRMGLDTKFIVADTAGGSQAADYAEAMLKRKELAPYLGPVGFHCWDGLTASEASYRRIWEVARAAGKEVWCLEAGHDAQLWQQADPWASWENALRTAEVYAKTVRTSGASVMDYWTYEDNYPIVDGKTGKPYPVFDVLKQMGTVLAPGWTVVSVKGVQDTMQVVATVSPDGKETAILLVNLGRSGRVTLKGVVGSQVSVETTTRDTADGSKTRPSVSIDRSVAVEVPTRSVVSVVAR